MEQFKHGDKAVLLGIGGSGMKGLARILAAKGVRVSGCDANLEAVQSGQKEGMEVLPERQGLELVKNADYVIYSDALPPEHPLRLKAKNGGKKLLAFHEALGIISRGYRSIAVTGTHGKTSTTAMLAKILIEAGWDPTVLVGGNIREWDNANARIGQSEWLVMEADEYREHFLALKANHIIITSIDYDHPDYFKSLREVKEAYIKFLGGIAEEGNCVVAERTYRELPATAWPPNLRIVSEEEEQILVERPGRHWQRNAALAVAMAEEIGIKKILAVKAVKNPLAIGRRLEMVGKKGRTTFFSDYGHHPAEILATLEGVKASANRTPLTTIVEIHTPERLKNFRREYVQAFLPADEIILVPVFIPAGREPQEDINIKEEMDLLVKELREAGKSVIETGRDRDLRQTIGNTAKKRNVVVFSAGKLDSKFRKLFLKDLG